MIRKCSLHTGLLTFLNLLRLCAWFVCSFCKYFNPSKASWYILCTSIGKLYFLCKLVLYLFTLTLWLHCSCLYFWLPDLTQEEKEEFEISQFNCFPVHSPLLPSACWILQSTLKELTQTRQLLGNFLRLAALGAIDPDVLAWPSESRARLSPKHPAFPEVSALGILNNEVTLFKAHSLSVWKWCHFMNHKLSPQNTPCWEASVQLQAPEMYLIINLTGKLQGYNLKTSFQKGYRM